MNIVLIGFKNSGKSAVGKLLSLMLNKKFFDTDEILKNLFFKNYPNKENRLKIFEIFNFLKEEKFRHLEKEAFFSIKDIENSVIATGGGAILNEKSFQLLENPKIIVYLKASIKTLKKRLQENKKKSIFQDQIFFEKTFNLRKVLYENLADLTIQTEKKDIEEIGFDIKNQIDKKQLQATKYLYV